MDCDFSHDPADVSRLIAAADDADLVLGSRYAPGGGTANWGLVRRIVSRGGCLYAQVLLGLRVRDLTGGFKCFRRAALEAIDLDALSAHGYAFQIETTYRVRRAGLRGREVPITFVERRAGASKMTGSIVAEAMWGCRCSGCGRSPASCSHGHGRRGAVRERGARVAGARDRRLLGAVVQAVRGDRAAPPWARGRRGRERVRLVRVNVDEEAGLSGALRRSLAADGDPVRWTASRGDGPRRSAPEPLRARVRAPPVTTLAVSWADLLEGEEVAYSGIEPAATRRSSRCRTTSTRGSRPRSSRPASPPCTAPGRDVGAARRGENVVVTTGTASGKSLAFNLPVLDAIAASRRPGALPLSDEGARQDQARTLAELRLKGLRPAIYDGDTPGERRWQIRKWSNAVLTNPDMLHVGVLPHHDRWGDVSRTCATSSSTRRMSTAASSARTSRTCSAGCGGLRASTARSRSSCSPPRRSRTPASWRST